MNTEEKRPVITSKCTYCGRPVKFRLPDHPGLFKFICKNPECGKTFAVNVPEDIFNKIKPNKTEIVVSRGNGVTLANSRICSLVTKKRSLFDSSKTFPLKKGKNVIGRKDSVQHSDIELDDPTISRQSIIIDVEEKGNGYKYRFKVIKCTNPVCVDGEQKDVNIEYYIEPGAKILLGRTTLVLKLKKHD